MFTIRIETGNASFHPYRSGEEYTDTEFDDAAPEIARILRKLADRIESEPVDPDEIFISDYNGNRVGSAKFSED